MAKEGNSFVRTMLNGCIISCRAADMDADMASRGGCTCDTEAESSDLTARIKRVLLMIDLWIWKKSGNKRRRDEMVEIRESLSKVQIRRHLPSVGLSSWLGDEVHCQNLIAIRISYNLSNSSFILAIAASVEDLVPHLIQKMEDTSCSQPNVDVNIENTSNAAPDTESGDNKNDEKQQRTSTSKV
ncbi:unnamed protein product [Ilex paraguariensis]|uniref:Uncharacterized protein n=1 Tax=Ilex paraguariensis TaxID=185542 RepID=A0ABC8RDW8_9AQUA